jgi:glycosyltransferase involved in cell wall biosynthesis
VEAFERVSLEAMVCGKPVVGPRAGGSLDLIEDGSNGRFFEPRDAKDFAAKVLWYHETRDRAHSHGANALKSVEDQFSTRTMIDAYLDLDARLLAR